MRIGLIGFGKVGQNLFKLIKSEDIEFVTSLENRSSKTSKAVKDSGIKVLDTFREVAVSSDILISANSPKSALDAAESYGKYCRGIYLDLNNISPETTSKIYGNVENFIDGAIIGKIDSDSPVLYISGKSCDSILFLNEYITTKKISDNVGDASILKMLRSTYTKTLSALLIESYELSLKYDLENEFFETLSLTEGVEFRQKSLSRIRNTLESSERKSEELEEIISFFGDDLIMVKAALGKLNQLSHEP